MASKVRRTYSSRPARVLPAPSSPPSGLSSPPAISESNTTKRKRPLIERLSTNSNDAPPLKKRATSTKQQEKNRISNKKALTQLHFSLETSVLKTCALCEFTYTKGVPDDESLHRAHCGRVQRGMEWGREEEREKTKAGVEEVATGIRLKDGRKGRIICFKADVGGKIGSKIKTLLDTINLTLLAPPLTQATLQASKFYLFLLPFGSSASAGREKIIGCVVAQRIYKAMAISSPPPSQPSNAESETFSSNEPRPEQLISVDPTLFCDSTLLPTPMGIPRLFVSASHRRQHVALSILSAAARTFIHGCPLDPAKGEVAFTQPTSRGRAVMEFWGKGGVRVYVE